MRLLIVEDSVELVDMLRRQLGQVGFALDHAGSVQDGLLMLEVGHYAALILDIGLPDGSGLELARAMRARGDDTPTLLLTAHSSVADRVAGLGAGGDDYLVKPFAPEEMIARIKALLRRSAMIVDRDVVCGNIRYDPVSRTVTVGGTPTILSSRELDMLALLIQRHDRVVAKTQIELQLFGLEEELGSNAVEVYIHRLRRRLGKAGATAQVVTIRGVGYMLLESPA